MGQCARMRRMIRRRWPRTSLPDGVLPGLYNDRDKEAAIIVMRVEQRELLMTMRDIASIVDIECDGLRGRGVTGAIEIDEDAAQLQNFAQSRGVSQRDMVGCEHRSFPVSGNRPQASLKAGSLRR